MMNIPFKARVIPAVLAGLLAGGSVVWADDEVVENESTDVEVVEPVSTVPAEKINGVFADFLSQLSPESQITVEGLRDGSVSYQPPEEMDDGVTGDAAEDVVETDEVETDEVEGAETEDMAQGMGYGNVFITLALSEQLALASAAEALEGETGMTADESLNEVLRLRVEEGMGWGNIAKTLGFNLGEVMSGYHSNRPEKAEMVKSNGGMRAEKADKGMRPAKAEKVAKLDKVERPVKPERMEKAERPEKPERPVKPERPERPGK